MGERNERVQRAIEIGKEMAAISTVIEEGRIAYGNGGLGSKAFIYESALFAELSEYRETLRDEIRDMG